MERVKATLRVKRYSLVLRKPIATGYALSFVTIECGALTRWQLLKVGRFLKHLAIGRRFAAGTQNQALNAIVFHYRHALDQLQVLNQPDSIAHIRFGVTRF